MKLFLALFLLLLVHQAYAYKKISDFFDHLECIRECGFIKNLCDTCIDNDSCGIYLTYCIYCDNKCEKYEYSAVEPSPPRTYNTYCMWECEYVKHKCDVCILDASCGSDLGTCMAYTDKCSNVCAYVRNPDIEKENYETDKKEFWVEMDRVWEQHYLNEENFHLTKQKFILNKLYEDENYLEKLKKEVEESIVNENKEK